MSATGNRQPKRSAQRKYRFDRSAARCPENPVAVCDGHGALLVAANEILAAAHAGRWRGPAQDRAAEESGMLTEPCQGVFMQSGRWIFI